MIKLLILIQSKKIWLNSKMKTMKQIIITTERTIVLRITIVVTIMITIIVAIMVTTAMVITAWITVYQGKVSININSKPTLIL